MAMGAQEQAEWESWVRANMTTKDVTSYHSRLRGDSGWCFGCVEMWLRYVKAPCAHRLAVERRLEKEKGAQIAAPARGVRRG